jgi:N-methylhydantoinase A
MYRIAVDVGGTFTDVVGVDDAGTVTFAKSPSTPLDQSIGVMNGLALLSDRLDMPLATLLANTERVVHGMTVATNALVERRGANVGLLTTAGHRDILEMREGLKPERYNMRLPRPEPLVPRSQRLGVRERLRADGSVETPLDAESLNEAIDALKRANVDSVAVCYLHAYRDDVHEQATRKAVEVALPDVYVCLSSEVLPQIKEYQRVSTTVVNAYVGPLIRGYLQGLERRLESAGLKGPLLVMLSHGGVAPVAEAVRIAASTVLSGPAGGLAGAKRAAAMLGVSDLIPFDMGGTSSDISLIVDGEVTLSADRAIASEQIALPSLDIITLGAGGGSIGRVETGELLKVGPQSAGAVPGPACYGHGSKLATVTDASLILGYLDSGNFLGGSTKLDREAAELALELVGQALGIDKVRAAEGIHRVINTHMAEGIRLATVRRGADPRRFSLLGFGGAAGLHVTALARLLSLERVLIPRVASVLSAWGMLTTELRLESTRSLVGETDRLDGTAVGTLYDDMCAHGEQRLRSWFSGQVETRRSAEMRYGEQIYEIAVSLDDIDFDAPDALQLLKSAFERRHEELYTYSLPEQQPVLVNARVTTVGLLPALPDEPSVSTSRPATPIAERQVFIGRWQPTPVYGVESLAPGQVMTAERWLDIAVH